MVQRRSLVEGITNPPPPVDPSRERDFVYGKQIEATPAQTPLPNQNRVPLSTRIRSDLASALKKASLERQLNNTQPNTVQDILEEAIENWLKSSRNQQTSIA